MRNCFGISSPQKQNNINDTIRTAITRIRMHDCDLCDEYGLYLIAENNLESHGMDIHRRGIRGIEGVCPMTSRRKAVCLTA